MLWNWDGATTYLAVTTPQLSKHRWCHLGVAVLAVGILACGARDATVLACEQPSSGSASAAFTEMVDKASHLSTCGNEFFVAARLPPVAQAGSEITVQVKVINGASVARPIRYRLQLMDIDGETALVKSAETVVNLPINAADERGLTLTVPIDTPPGAYNLALDTGLRRRIGTTLEPLRVIAPLVVGNE